MRWLTCALLVLALACSAAAEQVFVRNKPYKGTVQGSGAQIQVELGAFVEALGMALTERNGNWVIAAAGETPAAPDGLTGKIIYAGQPLADAPQGAATVVPMRLLAEAVGAKVVVNQDLGTVDVYAPKPDRPAAAADAGNPGYPTLIFFTSDT